MSEELGQDTVSQEILRILQEAEGKPLTKAEIVKKMRESAHEKTIQRRLSDLSGKLIQKDGKTKSTKYWIESVQTPQKPLVKGRKAEKIQEEGFQFFSSENQEIVERIQRGKHERTPVSYQRVFLDSYKPNQTFYLSEEKRIQLHQMSGQRAQAMPAGTYAKKILDRLLIDLSYNSSRLEGNTYSLLDTEKLIQQGESAEDKTKEETLMILNHKTAISFLVEQATEVGLTSYSVKNLHYALTDDLLSNPDACGNIRSIAVSIGSSVYTPLEIPALIEECFELILLKARKIEDPFERSFFVLAHIAYLQPFEDGNKRTSRIVSNIPLIKENLCPNAFLDVPREVYADAVLSLYELNEVGPLIDIFMWSYERSCRKYETVMDNVGEVDPFRVQYRNERKRAVTAVILAGLKITECESFIEDWSKTEVAEEDRERFTAHVLVELGRMHEGSLAGHGVTLSQFQSWKEKQG